MVAHKIHHVLELKHDFVDAVVLGQQQHPLGDILGKIANPLKIVGNAQGSDDLAQINRHRLPAGNGGDGLFLNHALQRIDPIICRYDPFGERSVALKQGIDRVSDLLAVEAAHLRNVARKLLQVCVKSPKRVVHHDSVSR